jgi:HK97 family phage prohead protease
MLTKDYAVRIKSLDEAAPGSFIGYGSVYDVEDLGGDVVARGAFTKSLQSNSKLPLLWAHDTREPVGTATASDSTYGLQISGQLLMGLPTAQKAYELLKAGVVRGLSVGYDAIKASSTPNGGRLLTEIKLWELSLCVFPMNTAAVITGVKALDQVSDLLRSVKPADVKDDVLRHLRNIDNELKRLLTATGDVDREAQRREELKVLRELSTKLKALVSA